MEDDFSFSTAFNETFLARALQAIGIHDYYEQEKLIKVVKHCARTKGLEGFRKGAVTGFAAGAVLEGVGAVPGAVVGALAGLALSTATCSMEDTKPVQVSEIQELRMFSNSLQ